MHGSCSTKEALQGPERNPNRFFRNPFSDLKMEVVQSQSQNLPQKLMPGLEFGNLYAEEKVK